MSDKLDELYRQRRNSNIVVAGLALAVFIVVGLGVYAWRLTPPNTDLHECLATSQRHEATARECLELMTDAAGDMVRLIDERDEARGVVGVICGPDAGFWP